MTKRKKMKKRRINNKEKCESKRRNFNGGKFKRSNRHLGIDNS
jgi:hypothetical protein